MTGIPTTLVGKKSVETITSIIDVEEVVFDFDVITPTDWQIADSFISTNLPDYEIMRTEGNMYFKKMGKPLSVFPTLDANVRNIKYEVVITSKAVSTFTITRWTESSKALNTSTGDVLRWSEPKVLESPVNITKIPGTESYHFRYTKGPVLGKQNWTIIP